MPLKNAGLLPEFKTCFCFVICSYLQSPVQTAGVTGFLCVLTVPSAPQVICELLGKSSQLHQDVVRLLRRPLRTTFHVNLYWEQSPVMQTKTVLTEKPSASHVYDVAVEPDVDAQWHATLHKSVGLRCAYYELLAVYKTGVNAFYTCFLCPSAKQMILSRHEQKWWLCAEAYYCSGDWWMNHLLIQFCSELIVTDVIANQKHFDIEVSQTWRNLAVFGLLVILNMHKLQ